jgi:hypothetical protein
VISSGTLTVASGGSVSGGLTLSGGKAIISGTVAAGQSVTYAGSGGELVLAAAASFTASISGFAGTTDEIDLPGFTYNSATETRSFTEATGNTSGTLTVSSGGKTETLTLLGNYVTSNFTLSNDGGGGTLIVDPPLKHQPQAIGGPVRPEFAAGPAVAAAADWRALFAPFAFASAASATASAGDAAAPLGYGFLAREHGSGPVIALVPHHPA